MAIATAVDRTDAEGVIVPERIVIAAALPGAPYDRFTEHHELVLPSDGIVMESDELADALEGATALVPLLIHRVDAALLDRAPGLRIVANVAVAYPSANHVAVRQTCRQMNDNRLTPASPTILVFSSFRTVRGRSRGSSCTWREISHEQRMPRPVR